MMTMIPTVKINELLNSDIVGSIVSPEHIRFKAYGVDTECTVADMADRLKATNNCWDASEAVLKRHLTDFQVYAERVLVSGIQTPAGNHYAILCIKGEHEIIIDYTARQFDETVAYPLVIDAYQWQEWVESKIGRQGNWMHDMGFFYDD